MFIIFIRTVIIYIILIMSMRLLGKRQLGELEVSELITTILLSEIAAIPISDPQAPLWQAAIPLMTIIAFEVTLSFLTSRYSRLRHLLSSPPSVLIRDGIIDQRELLRNRISPEELLSELRLNSVSDPSQVKYAILEQNGLMSVIPKARFQTPTAEQVHAEISESGTVHIIISQGHWNEHNLKMLKKDRAIFEKYLSYHDLKKEDVFLLTLDDSGCASLVIRDRV